MRKRIVGLLLAFVMVCTLFLQCIPQSALKIEAATTISLNRPLDKAYTITAREYYSEDDYHGAIDYGCPKGTPVYAAESGTISVYDGGYDDGYYGSTDGSGWGNYADISHGNGYYTRYAHMSTGRFVVSSGSYIQRGQLIGYSGNSGNSTGAHLHFGLYLNGLKSANKVYPEPYITTATGYFNGGSPTTHSLDSSYGANITAYPKAKITAENIFDANHNQISSGAWIGTSDKCTIHEVYTDGCCKVTYPLDSGGSKTVYSKISLFRASTPSVKYWVSSTEYGDEVSEGTAGNSYYLCYYLYDSISKKDWDEVVSSDYEIRLTIYYPDGTVKYTNENKFDYDRSWIRSYFGEAGTYKVELTGISGYLGSSSKSFVVKDNSIKVNCSANSLSLKLGGTESQTIYVGYSGYYSGNWVISYSRSNSNVSCTWGDWTDDNRAPLTIKANAMGTTTVTISIKDKDTGAVLDSTTVTVTVGAKAYAVSYNANGGSGAPVSQTKYHNTTLTLSSTKPTKTGHTFLGWSTSSTATSASYQPGGSFTNNASTTLYAVWKVNTYTVTYNANGGTGAPSSQTKTHGVSLALSTTKPTRAGYTFLGWATSSTATSASYQPGGSFTSDADTTLYAVWKNGCEGGAHDYVYNLDNAPTVSTLGYVTGTCSQCQSTISITLPKLNTTDYSYAVTKIADCTATGIGQYTWKTTAYGTYKFEVNIAATEHNYTSKVTAPTCTAQGYTSHTCTCGYSYKDSYTNATGHSYTYKATTAPTTSATGVLTGTCSKCSGTTTVTLPKLNTTDYTYSVTKEPSYTATGVGTYTWKTTTYGTFKFDVSIEKLIATLSKIEVATNPTKTSYKLGESLDATGLTLKLIYSDGTSRIVTTGFTVSGFDSTTVGTKVITVTYEEKTTNIIINVIEAPVYLKYKITDDGVVITDCDNFIAGDIVIPNSIEGYPVIGITNTAFWNCSKLTSVTIPDSIINIEGLDPFVGCTSLTGIWVEDNNSNFSSDGLGVLYNKEKTILFCAPKGMDGNYTIPNSVTSIADRAFDNCIGLTSVTIPDSVTSIGSSAFAFCSELSAINIPNSVTSIGAWAFNQCINLTSVTIPDGVTHIGNNAFTKCSGLKEICVDSNNKNYSSDSKGVLFDKGKTKLFMAPGGLSGSYTIPDSVSIIDSYAFIECKKLTKISIPVGVYYVGSYTFADCIALSELSFTGSAPFIGTDTFRGVTATVYYPVDDETWEEDAMQDAGGNITWLPSVTLSGIAIASNSAKTVYYVGESLDTTGLTLKLTYSDGSTKTVTSGFTTSGFDSSTAGAKTVTVTYEGKTATFTVTVTEPEPEIDENAPQIIVSEVQGMAGDTVTVIVSLKNNPGFSGLNAFLTYAEGLTLLEVTNATSLTFTNDRTMVWDGVTDYTEDGELLRLTFRISDSAEAGDYFVKINIIEAYTAELDDVTFATADGAVHVLDFAYGDANGDGVVNTKDIILIRRHVAAKDPVTGQSTVEIKAGADANGDGVVNTKDIILVRRHVAAKDPTTGESTVVLGPTK